MQRYVIDLRLSRAQVLRLYEGSADKVVGRARSGQRIQFPLQSLRRYVAAEGVEGTFQLSVDGRHRLVAIERLG